jgi:hypothetical protein
VDPTSGTSSPEQQSQAPLQGQAPTTDPVEQPGFGSRGRARRRARFLRRARELAYRDLGGLVFDLHRFGQRNDTLVLAKLSTLDHIDSELRTIERALRDRRPVTVLREAGITACPRCAAIHGSEDRFCPNCGLSIAPRAQVPIASSPAPAAAMPAAQVAAPAPAAAPAAGAAAPGPASGGAAPAPASAVAMPAGGHSAAGGSSSSGAAPTEIAGQATAAGATRAGEPAAQEDDLDAVREPATSSAKARPERATPGRGRTPTPSAARAGTTGSGPDEESTEILRPRASDS